MIGLVVTGTPWGQDDFSPIVYHKFDNGKTVLETTIKNCLDSALLQRVVITMPQDQARTALELDKRGRFGSATIQFHRQGDPLDILYTAAQTHSFDYVVNIHADQVLLPGWLINNVVVEYMESGINDFCRTHSSPGFDIKVMPFWKLAKEFVEREEERSKLVGEWKYLPDSKLSFPRSFVFDAQETEVFDSILHTVSLGYDVDQVIEDYLDGDKQKTAEEQSALSE